MATPLALTTKAFMSYSIQLRVDSIAQWGCGDEWHFFQLQKKSSKLVWLNDDDCISG